MTREEAKEYIREWCPYDRQEEIIKALEQEPKTGRWIHNKCDKCGASRPPLFDNYCPNCGCRMVEPQEKE